MTATTRQEIQDEQAATERETARETARQAHAGRVTVTKEPLPVVVTPAPVPEPDHYIESLLLNPPDSKWAPVKPGTQHTDEQVKAMVVLDIAFALASRHASEQKVQNYFREKYAVYRGMLVEELTPDPPVSITATSSTTLDNLTTTTTGKRRGRS